MSTRSKNSVSTSSRAAGGGGSTRSPGSAASARSKPVGDVGVEVGDPGGDGVAAQRPALVRDVDAGERRQQRLAVAHGAGHRPGVVERRSERDDPAERDEPARRLDRRRPALGRGDAQRAGGVGARRRRHLPRGERRAGAAAGAARRPLERPRVADLVGRPAAGELVRVQVAEQHHPVGARAAPRRRSRAQGPRPARGSTRSAACRRPRRGPSSPIGTPHSTGASPAASRSSARSAAASASSS